MNKSRHVFLCGALCSGFAVGLLSGCAANDDPIRAAEQADKKAGIAVPGIAETKAIAEEALHLRPAHRDELCSDAGVLG